jgi:hypothetical protein
VRRAAMGGPRSLNLLPRFPVRRPLVWVPKRRRIFSSPFLYKDRLPVGRAEQDGAQLCLSVPRIPFSLSALTLSAGKAHVIRGTELIAWRASAKLGIWHRSSAE